MARPRKKTKLPPKRVSEDVSPALRSKDDGSVKVRKPDSSQPTEQQLAELAGLSRVGLSRVLSGTQGITIERLAKLANVLEVPAWKLMKPSGQNG